MKRLLFLFLSCIMVVSNIYGQDPHRFDKEIEVISQIPVPQGKDIAVFTGSSSIRFWKSVQSDCNGFHAINTGFGGSHMSDLLFFIEQTVLRFHPDKVFIYEGDNDIAAEKSPSEILKTAQLVVELILQRNPEAKLFFISAKPSPSRWAYKKEYKAFNARLKDFCTNHEQVNYIDVWTGMLGNDGRPDPSIFVADSLHMNRQGYLLWKDIICSDFND